MNTGIKKIFIAATALGLVLSSIDAALGATHHHKHKPPHGSHAKHTAADQVKLLHLMELGGFKWEATQKLAGKIISDTAKADALHSEALGMVSTSSAAAVEAVFVKEHALRVKVSGLQDRLGDVNAMNTLVTALADKAENKAARVTIGEWDNLTTQVNHNTSAISGLTTTVSEDVGHLQDQITTNDKSISDNASAIKKNADKITALSTDLASFHTSESGDIVRLANVLEREIETNADNIEKNSKAIGVNHQEIERNVSEIKKVGQQVKLDAEFITKNAKTGERNTKSVKEAEERIKANMKLLTTFHGDLLKVAGLAHNNAENIKSNLSLIHSNLGLINANTKAIHTSDANIETNANNIHQLGLTVQDNSNQIVRTANNELRNMKVVQSLGEAVKQNVGGVELNTQLAKALDQQSLIDESALQKMNAEIFENAAALGNTTVVSEDGDDLMVGAKNLANLSQLLAVAHHHNAQAKKAANNNLQETTARLQALHIALTKAQDVSKHDATLTQALEQPIENAKKALQTSQHLTVAIDTQRTRLHMQGKTDSEVIAKVRVEVAGIAKQKEKLIREKQRLQHQIATVKARLAQTNQYKNAADENAKRAHQLAIQQYYDSELDKQPHDVRGMLRIKASRDMMLKEVDQH